MKRFAKIGIATACAMALTAGSALAQEAAADQDEAQAARDARVELLEELGALMDDRLGQMARPRGTVPFDAEVVKTTAEEMAELAAQIPDLFAVDTRGFTLETNARDNIWVSHASFLDRSRDLDTAIANLQEVAETGDQRRTIQAIALVGRACGACHDAHKNN